MARMDLFSVLIILSCLHVHSVWSNIGTSEINCVTGTNEYVGSVMEEYEGVIEIITNIQPDDRLVLEGYFIPIGVTFLELVYLSGDTTATVRTRKPLDAEKLKESGGSLYYSVSCSNTGMKNIRTVEVQDINDNRPIFQSKTYSKTVSETTDVGSDVLRVTADDADVSPENNRIIYSILPPAPDEFEVRSDGNIRLKQPLNYDNVQQYIFTVQAKDKDEFSDTTTVTITVEDYDNLNPYFDHSLYKNMKYVHSHRKLRSENKVVTSELEKVLSPGLEIKVEDSPGNTDDSSQAVTIAVSVVLAVIIVTLASILVKNKVTDSNRQTVTVRKRSIDIPDDFNTNPEPREVEDSDGL